MGIRFETEKFEDYQETGSLILWYLDFTGSPQQWPGIAETIQISQHGPTMVGRAVSPTGLCLADPRISRQHAMLELTDNGLRITDLGSSNGTYVNGVIISGPVDLCIGDQVHFDRISFRVRRSLNIPELKEEVQQVQSHTAGFARERLIQARRDRLINEGVISRDDPKDIRAILERRGMERRMQSRYSTYLPVLTGSMLAICFASVIIYLF